ncbi:MAG: Hpt domain-containing protein [Tepidamorphaceae bacterium]
MEKLSVSFNMWMEDEIDTLREAHTGTKKDGMTGEARQALFRAAHDIRGEAGTLGFPLVGQAASSLADLLSMLPDDVEIPDALIEGHVQRSTPCCAKTHPATTTRPPSTWSILLREAQPGF